MSTWTSTLVPVGSLILGALLTMGGQVLADRRAARREHDARRDGFKIQNFEVHRKALLETQEALSGFSRVRIAEKIRRKVEGDYDFFDADPLSRLAAGQGELQEMVNKVMLATTDLDSDPSRIDIKEQIKKDAEQFSDRTRVYLDEVKQILGNFTLRFDRRSIYTSDLADFIYKLRLGMYRSGSNAVVQAGEEYLNALIKWDQALASRNSMN